MTGRNKRHPALKHGGYSSAGILPGESAADFAKLHRGLIAEFAPQGALEVEIVKTIAHCLWRRRNLSTFRIAKRAQRFMQRTSMAALHGMETDLPNAHDSTEFERNLMDQWNAAESLGREQLGDFYGLVEMGEEATIDALKDELEVQSRLDAMIDRCIKRLLLVRGLKSMTIGSISSTPERPALPYRPG